MKKTASKIKFVSFSAAIFATSLASCSNSNFLGTGNAQKVNDTKKPSSNSQVQTPAPTAVPTQLPPVPTQMPVRPTATPYIPVPTATPYVPTPTPVPPQPTQVPVAPTPTPVVPQPSPDTNAGNGQLTFAVAAIANMESDYQATTPGFRAILKDASGRLIAAGPLTLDAVMDGQAIDAQTRSGFPAFALKAKMLYVSSNIPKSGNGKLFVCMPQDPMAAMEQSVCKYVKGGPFGDGTGGASEGSQFYRPFQWHQGKAVTYNVDEKNNITIDGYGSGMGLTGSSLPNLAIMNSMFTAATGEKVAMIDARSPLVLNMGNKGFDLTSVWDDKNPVTFDLMNNGKEERIGWIGSKSGLLAIDLNGNKKIDNGSELFGEYSSRVNESQKKGLADANFIDGFSALAQYDSNFDGVIDAKDPIFKKLVVWNGKNRDAANQASDMKTLDELKIKAIQLDFTRMSTIEKKNMVNGNELRLLGHYVTTDGKRHEIADVWFSQRTATTKLEDIFPKSRQVASKNHH